MALLGNFFNKEETRALGIDIGSSAIKVVQVRKVGAQAVLETYGALALGPYGGANVGQAVQLPSEKIASALVDLMREKEVNITTKRSGLSIPFSSSLMSIVELPQVTEKQLATMVPFEARKYIPVPISEVMLDWSVIPRNSTRPGVGGVEKVANPNEQAKLDVLIVAIHNNTITHYREIVAKAGLQAGFFEIELFSTMRSVLDDSLQPVLIVDMGAATTKLYIIERGLIRSSHTVNRGSQDITATLAKSLGISISQAEVMKREKGLMSDDKNFVDVVKLSLDYIFAETNTALLAFEKKHNKTISKVLLVGGGAALKGFSPLAEENLKAPVELGAPFGKLATPAFLEKILRETGPEFAVAVGLALRRLAEEG